MDTMKLTIKPGTTLGPFDLVDEDGNWFASANSLVDAERTVAFYDAQPSQGPSLEELLAPAALVAHAGCAEGQFCRNPLHPGPCKGWKRGIAHHPTPTVTRTPSTARKRTGGVRKKAAPTPPTPAPVTPPVKAPAPVKAPPAPKPPKPLGPYPPPRSTPKYKKRAPIGSSRSSAYDVLQGDYIAGSVEKDYYGTWYAYHGDGSPVQNGWGGRRSFYSREYATQTLLAEFHANPPATPKPYIAPPPKPRTPRAPAGPPPAPAAATSTASPAAQAAQDVLYGADAKGTTAARQIQVYGAMRISDFSTLQPHEQQGVLADLSFISHSSKGANKTKADQLINRFMPAGTPVGTVPSQPILPGSVTAAQTRVADPLGDPGKLTLLPKGQRGKSGDGWTRGKSGRGGPWGQYGAAGLMLRHVDDQGVERFLMVERGPGISDPGKWQFPGGAKEELESFYEGATREVVEELGFAATAMAGARVHGDHTVQNADVEVPGPGGAKIPWSYVSVAATVPTQLKPDLSSHHAQMETSDAKWMTRAEIDALDTKGKLLRPLAGGALQQNVLSLFPPPAAKPGGVSVPVVTKRQPRLRGVPGQPKPKQPWQPSIAADLVTAKADRDKLRQDVKQARAQYAGKTADDRLAAIGAIQGFDRKPVVVDKAEFARLLATGEYVEMWRGVRGRGAYSGATRGGATSRTKTSSEINEQMRTGTAYYGTGMFGNGYYFATNKNIATGYSDQRKGGLIRVLMPKAAKTKKYNDVIADRRAAGISMSSKAKGRSGEEATLWDEGRFAAAQGLDAIEIPMGTSGAGHVALRGSPAYNVLNRSILIIEEE